MTHHETNFDTIFKYRGGFFDHKETNTREFFETVLKSMNQTLTQLQERNPRCPNPKLFLISNDALNAVAAKHNNEYYIGFNAGTIFILKNLFDRMLSTPAVLPQFGDPSKVGIEKIYNARVSNLGHLFLATGSTSPIIPADYTRSVVSDYMTNIAFTFLLRHEFGHIVHGHLDYMQAQKGLSAIDEEDGKSNNPAFSQTLEMDADSYATNDAVRDMLNLSLRKPESIMPELRRFVNIKENLFIHTFAIYALFRLLSNKLNSVDSAREYSHPPAVIRQVLILSNICTIFQEEKLGISSDEASRIATDAVMAVEEAFPAISEQELDHDTFASAFTPEAYAYTEQIYHNWINVRPILEKYAFAQLPATNT